MSDDIKETTSIDNSKIDRSNTDRANDAPHDDVLPGDSGRAEPGGGLSGKRLAHYRLVEKLGGGGVAVVYRAIDEITDTPVAVKILLSGADEIMRERFRREAELVRTLHHPHIVKTLDVGETSPDAAWAGPEDSIAYIVLELIEGYSLSQLLERHGRLSASDAAAILAPIAQALDFAHAQDIVHRDVKPSNILLRRETTQTPGSVRISALDYAVTPLLTDFGIARAMDAPELTSAGRTIGTPAFMSPEQCAGEERIDGRADVYGLGAVLYRCVVGKTPYQGSTTQMLYAHVYEPLLIPEEMVALLPPIALATLQRAMMKDPAQRYQDADEMAHDLSLAAAPSAAHGSAEDDDALVTHTITMATLPVVRKENQAEGVAGTSRVLVPVTAPQSSARTTFPRERPRTTVKLETAVPRARGRASLANSARRELLRRRSWGAKLAMVAAAVLLVAAGIATVSLLFMNRDFGILPAIIGNWDNNGSDSVVAAEPPPAGPLPSPSITRTPATGSSGNEDETGGEGGSNTPTADIAATPPRAVVDADPITTDQNDVSGDGGDAINSPDDEGGENDAIDQATSDAEATPTPPTVSLETAWEDANDFFVEEDWEAARDWLLMVRRIDPEFEAEQVRAMLETAYLELAQTAFDQDELDMALQMLLEAAAEQPAAADIDHLSQAYTAFQDADNDAAVEDLRAALADVADALVEADAPCRALLYGNAAVALGDTTESVWLANLVEACNETQTPQLPSLAGRLIYSSQEGDTYSIYAMPVNNLPNTSSILVQNASQPRLPHDGGMIAFHSRHPSAQGLSGLEMFSGQNPSSRSVSFTGHVEDSRDSPPSWSPDNSRLAFSSTRFGDGRHRIYITSADANQQVQELRTGKDPAWHPWQDLLVFNGVDDAGQNPGLWLMRSDGSDLRQLTDNGNDLRPAWTPDGNAIVFMSNGRHGNWELYRLDMDSLVVTRLTFSDAQDGLPAISPDGVYVAFASDRSGFWEFWYTPIYGGDSLRLGSMHGQLVSWLEHGLQWTP